MDWLKTFLDKHLNKGIAASAWISAVNFFVQMAEYLQDGELDNNEIHQLLMSSSGLEVLILMLIYGYLKYHKK